MNENDTYDVAIIGGGAAGLVAAIAAAWKGRLLQAESAAVGVAGGANAAPGVGVTGGAGAGAGVPAVSGAAENDQRSAAASDPVLNDAAAMGARACSPQPARVILFEADDRVGRSILATGNGRCNFSNSAIELGVYHNAAFVEEALSSLERAAFWPRGNGACDGALNGGNADVYVAAASDPATDAADAAATAAADAATTATETGNSRAACNAVLDFFFYLGLCWREEGQGRLFPVTGKASTVLDVLRAAARALGVEECCNAQVRCIEPPREPGKPYTLRMADGTFQRAHAVVCAAGGSVAQKLLPNDLAFYAMHPVLGPLKTETQHVRALDNIRVRCVASLERAGVVVAAERGEVLFRKYGLSGIAIFNLSRFAQVGDTVVLDLVPDMSQAQLCSFLDRRAHSAMQLQVLGHTNCHMDGYAHSRTDQGANARVEKWGQTPRQAVRRNRSEDFLTARASDQVEQRFAARSSKASEAAENVLPTCDDALRGLLLPLVAEAVLKRAGLKPADKATPAHLQRVAQVAKRFSVTVEGMGDAKQCQVHRGGFSCAEFEPATMECARYAGLFAAGEMLDVDAPCGGYNLHWAWASGLLAGASAAVTSFENRRKAR